ncbi:hypothetical protein [Streptomyces hundungensis]|uniref:hypothetical protein n=1 Tax=Streptomyces hundungensis TaxID=1077946 RepID=UPI0033FD371C
MSRARHAFFHQVNARNRICLACRHLPALMVLAYLGVRVAPAAARTRSLDGLKAWLGGFVEGWRTPRGLRKPMRWRTAWKLACLGHPRVI